MSHEKPIPMGIYWSREAGNFYDAITHKGMGWDFYNLWKDRKDEFPERRNSGHQWKTIDYNGTLQLNVWTSIAWVAMVSFFVSIAFLLLTRADAAFYFMIVSLAVWLASGIAAIRIRGLRRRFIVVLNDPSKRHSA